MSRKEPYVQVVERIMDFPTRLAVDGSSNIGITIVAPCGPQLALIQSPNEFLANYTVDGLNIPRDAHVSLVNAYYMSFFASLVVARSMNSDVQGAIAIGVDSNAITQAKIYMKDGLELVKNNALTISSLPIDRSNFGFILNDVIYYGGDYDAVCAALEATNGQSGAEKVIYDVDFTTFEAVAIDTLLSDTPATNEILSTLCADINKRDTYVATLNNGIITLWRDQNTDKPILNKIQVLDDSGEYVEATVTPVTVTCTLGNDQSGSSVAGTRLFTIICKDAGSVGVNDCKITISKTRTFKGHKVFDITLQKGTGDPETYTVSLDPEAVDSSDVNCYIDQLNAMPDLKFTAQIDNEQAASTTWTTGLTQYSFGEGFITAADASSTAYLKAALDTLEDQESYKLAYLAPCGITSVPYVKTMIAMGIRNKWFSPCDVPYDRTNANSITAYGANIQDDYNAYMVGPFDKNVGLTGWMNYIAATTLYYERVMSNKALNNEFAPVFDANTGRVNYTNPVKLLKKPAREQLISLGLPINYVIYDQSIKGYYFNDNWTHYSQSENVLGEENNVRMLHKISRDLEDLYKQFKAQQNTETTRQKVVDITNLYFQSELMGQVTHPMEYMIICDRSNNTDYVINSRKLAVTVKVRLANSIKYIEVINEVYSLGGAPFTE